MVRALRRNYVRETENKRGMRSRKRNKPRHADPVVRSAVHYAVPWLLACLCTLVFGVWIARAQTTLSAEEKLEQDFNDPLTTLPQVLVRDSYTPANYGPCTPRSCVRNAETNQLIIRPLIPRIPPNTLLPFVQLVRPTFALVTVPSSRGGTRTEFGDLPMFDAAVLPWPDRKKTGLLIGVGPTFVFPTATSKSAGQGAWQAGPAFGGYLHRHSGAADRVHCAESH